MLSKREVGPPFLLLGLWGVISFSLWAEDTRRYSAPMSGTEVAPSRDNRRIALLIGNALYPSAPLANPINDVNVLAGALKECGFEVEVKQDCSRKQMNQVLRDFEDRLGGKEACLFYYSGHGLQIKGENFLVPVGADIQKESEAEDETVSVERVLKVMEAARTGVKLVILDACRDNPFLRSSRSMGKGLAAINTGESDQWLIAFATAPGKQAKDGNPGENSPFVKQMVRHIRTPGMKVEEFFKSVSAGVKQETGGEQSPWKSDNLTVEFCFVPTTKTAPLPETPAPPPATPAVTPAPTPVSTPGPQTGSEVKTGLLIKCLTPGAKVRINENLEGLVNQTIAVSEGNKRYSLEVFAPGCISQKVSIYVKADEVVSFNANLEKENPADFNSSPQSQQEKQEPILPLVEIKAIEAFIDTYYAALAAHNISALLDFYAPSIQYHSDGMVDRNFIQKEKIRYFQRWNIISFARNGSLRVAATPDGRSIDVLFTIRFLVRRPDKTVSGTAEDCWRLTPGENSFKIIAERQTNLRKAPQ